MTGTPRNPLQRRHRALAAWCVVVVAGMTGAAYAAVPLYRIFCQATGFDGTPRRASAGSSKVIEKTIVVRFDGNVAPGLPWRFEPVQNTMTVKVGENAEAHFRATNLSDHRIVGSATYNVAPDFIAAYFDKVQCFCFTEQALDPGQTADLALSFFIDPEMVHDLEARTATHVTVSYTFYPVNKPTGVAEKPGGKSG